MYGVSGIFRGGLRVSVAWGLRLQSRRGGIWDWTGVDCRRLPLGSAGLVTVGRGGVGGGCRRGGCGERRGGAGGAVEAGGGGGAVRCGTGGGADGAICAAGGWICIGSWICGGGNWNKKYHMYFFNLFSPGGKRNDYP